MENNPVRRSAVQRMLDSINDMKPSDREELAEALLDAQLDSEPLRGFADSPPQHASPPPRRHHPAHFPGLPPESRLHHVVQWLQPPLPVLLQPGACDHEKQHAGG